MPEYHLAEAEKKFAQLIWKHEPLPSRRLVELAAQELGWKSTTTYTVLRRLRSGAVSERKVSGDQPGQPGGVSPPAEPELCAGGLWRFAAQLSHGVYGWAQAHAGPGGGAAGPDRPL